jgi:hypothetical protein
LVTLSLLSSISGITHGFGSKDEPIPAHLADVWQHARPSWKQVHGNAIADVTPQQLICGEVDGLITRTRGQPIGVITADCTPILLAKRDGSAVAALHAGICERRNFLLCGGCGTERANDFRESHMFVRFCSSESLKSIHIVPETAFYDNAC